MVRSGDIVIVNSWNDVDLYEFAKVVEIFKTSERHLYERLILTFYRTIKTRTTNSDGKTIVEFRPDFERGTRTKNYEFAYVKGEIAWVGPYPSRNNLYTECVKYDPSKSYYIAFYW